MQTPQQDQENLDRWNRAAPFWEQHRPTIRTMFSPITQGLVQDAGIARGETILDVSTGPGEPALQLAEIIGPEGRVTGIDPITGMIEGARRAAASLGAGNARFETASVSELPFPTNHFDAAVCRLGAMFFPSPVECVREILRVLKPGHKLAFAVWSDGDHNPFFHVTSRIIDRFVPPAPADPDAPDAFRFAPAGKLLKIVTEAGVEAPAERVLKFPLHVPLPAEDFWPLRVGMSERFQQKLGSMNQSQVAEIRAQVIEAIREYSTPEGLILPSEVRIVSGQKTS